MQFAFYLCIITSFFFLSRSLSDEGHGDIFSGVYNPIIEHGLEIYSGAWLMPLQLFLTKKNNIDSIGQLEMTTTAMVMKPNEGGQNAVRHTLMSRDYFDFFVEHLSSLTNQIDSNNRVVNAHLVNITSSKIKIMRHFGLFADRSSEKNEFRNVTLAIIPFSVTGAYSDENSRDQVIRQNYFLLTFWSIYRYFRNIVVSVTKQSDMEALLHMNLPTFDIYYSNISSNIKSPRWLNPKQSLQFAYNNLISSGNLSYSSFEYVYFSEGDLILHMRSMTRLYSIMNNSKYHSSSNGNMNEYDDDYFILCPHRMQSLPLPKNFPDAVSSHIEKWRHNDLAHAIMITEKNHHTVSSCCDDGRYIFKDCGNWWYNCQGHGLKNITNWIKFGPHGFPMPLVTEHKGRCRYSSRKVLCPVPKTCTVRYPNVTQQICPEYPNIEIYYKG